jgi:hypothetical protein
MAARKPPRRTVATMSTQDTLAAITADDRRRRTANDQGRSERWAPLAGVVFAVAVAAAFLSAGDRPSVDASGREIIAHYDDADSILAAAPVAALALLLLAGMLRHRQRAAGAEWLATAAFGGAVVYAAGLGLLATTRLALLDAADLGQPQVAQALNVLDNHTLMPVQVGLAITLLATGGHALTARSLPTWLGRSTLALGALAIAGPASVITSLLFPVWLLVTAAVLFRPRPDTTTTTTPQEVSQ